MSEAVRAKRRLPAIAVEGNGRFLKWNRPCFVLGHNTTAYADHAPTMHSAVGIVGCVARNHNSQKATANAVAFCFVRRMGEAMSDEELVAAFESTQLPADEFTHTAHVRVAWWYLTRASLPEALLHFATALQRFAAAKGATGKYHETVTVAWMLIIADRLSAKPGSVWTEFAAANPDLFESPSVLGKYYAPETLASERARRAFVLPDICRVAR